MTQDPILRSVLERRDALDRARPPYESPLFVNRDLANVLDELGLLTTAAHHDRRLDDWSATRDHLVDVMAIAYRGLRDLQLHTAGAAAEKDIPF